MCWESAIFWSTDRQILLCSASVAHTVVLNHIPGLIMAASTRFWSLCYSIHPVSSLFAHPHSVNLEVTIVTLLCGPCDFPIGFKQ